jgi:hypothetical protein
VHILNIRRKSRTEEYPPTNGGAARLEHDSVLSGQKFYWVSEMFSNKLRALSLSPPWAEL